MLVDAARDDEHLEAIRALDIRSAMIVPMLTGGRALGVMSFVFAESGRRYGERDLAFAQELGGARRDGDRERPPLHGARRGRAHAAGEPAAGGAAAGCRAGASRPTTAPGQRGADVGGDFYDVFAVEGGQMVRARRRHRHGRDRRGADVARAPHGQDRRHVRPAPVGGARDGQPGAAPAPARRAGDDVCARCSATTSSRSRSAAIRCRCSSARAGPARRSARRACCSAPSTTTPSGDVVDGRAAARRHAAAVHRRRDGHAGRPTGASATTAARRGRRRARRAERAARGRSPPRSTRSPTGRAGTTARCSRCSAPEVRRQAQATRPRAASRSRFSPAIAVAASRGRMPPASARARRLSPTSRLIVPRPSRTPPRRSGAMSPKSVHHHQAFVPELTTTSGRR